MPAAYRRDESLPSQDIEGQAFVLSPARRQFHQLDEVGTFVWGLLGKPRTLAELAEAVAGEFDVDRAKAEEDLRGFLDELEKCALVLRP